MYSRTIEKEKDMLVSDVYIYIQKPIYEMHAYTHALLFKRIFCTMIQWYNGIRRASVFYCYGYYLSLSACDDDEDDDERNACKIVRRQLFIYLSNYFMRVRVFVFLSVCECECVRKIKYKCRQKHATKQARVGERASK